MNNQNRQSSAPVDMNVNWQAYFDSQNPPSAPLGIKLPENCRIAGNGQKIFDLAYKIFAGFEWLVDCGTYNNNARGIFKPALEQQGWKFCSSQTARSHWWKEGIVTGIAESASVAFPFKLTQLSGADCSSGAESASPSKTSPLPASCKSETEGQPVITSLSRDSGPVGSILEIRGCNLSGFEGDLDIIFERSDGKKILLTDDFGDYAKTRDTLIKIVVKEPCQQGETVYGRYSGIPAQCDYIALTPGLYKVYTEPWGKRSNTAYFNITPQIQNPMPKPASAPQNKTFVNDIYGLEFTLPGGYLVGSNHYGVTDASQAEAFFFRKESNNYNGVPVLDVSVSLKLSSDKTLKQLAQSVYDMNKIKNYSTTELINGSYGGIAAYEFGLRSGYANPNGYRELASPGGKVVLLYHNGRLFTLLQTGADDGLSGILNSLKFNK